MCQALGLELGTQDGEGKHISGRAWITLLSLARRLSHSDSWLNSLQCVLTNPLRVPFSPAHIPGTVGVARWNLLF